jgi:hypothetical protein
VNWGVVWEAVAKLESSGCRLKMGMGSGWGAKGSESHGLPADSIWKWTVGLKDEAEGGSSS